MELKADGAVSEQTSIDYEVVLARLDAADAHLMKPIDKCTRCKWLHE